MFEGNIFENIYEDVSAQVWSSPVEGDPLLRHTSTVRHSQSLDPSSMDHNNVRAQLRGEIRED